MSFNSWFGVSEDNGFSWWGFIILILIWIWSLIFDTPMFQILALYLDFEGVKNTHVLLDLDLGLLRMLEVSDWGLASWFWLGYGHWFLIQPQSKFWLSTLILKVQRTSMSFKSSFGALEDAGGSWLGFGILILIWIWSLVFDTPMIRILAFYLDFEGAKTIHIL